ncbi:glycosyltransferase family 4 protein [Synechococcus sp. UW105]|uniref:MraY family glycosyltransferase n=1 Tax=Synechococcus sp. UW105 TaxID=337067 RepID=UPI001FCBAF05|nr:glycosyltransferase family 4 protein [Synechococcus sp. UW105]
MLSASISWFLIGILIPLLKLRFLDNPNHRSSHTNPTPVGGGIVFVFVSSIASTLFIIFSGYSSLALLPLATVPIAFVGFLDDCHDLPRILRYGAHLAMAVFILLTSPLPHESILQITNLPLLISSLVLFIIIVTAVINFTNFMDGLDGLLAGCMSVLLATLAFHLSAPWPIWSLLGSILGFLIWNWSPAKLFMGDSGSTFLGSIFIALVLYAHSWLDALSFLIVSTPLLADASLSVCRRFLARQPIFQAHRLHLFQRLTQAGWNHRQVSLLYILSTTFLSIVYLYFDFMVLVLAGLLVLVLGFLLDRFIAVPFHLASRA